MIKGIGTDIIEIHRILKAVKNERFLQKYFTKNEILLFENKNIQTIAGNFACKEAVAKALGMGFRGFAPIDIEILRDVLGKPIVILHNRAKDIFDELEIGKIFVSISHCKEYATAVSFIE